jgi:hypothetical protein
MFLFAVLQIFRGYTLNHRVHAMTVVVLKACRSSLVGRERAQLMILYMQGCHHGDLRKAPKSQIICKETKMQTNHGLTRQI